MKEAACRPRSPRPSASPAELRVDGKSVPVFTVHNALPSRDLKARGGRSLTSLREAEVGSILPVYTERETEAERREVAHPSESAAELGTEPKRPD